MSDTIKIRLLDTKTGIEGEYETEWDGEGSWFQWTSGNDSCDCNRGMFLARSHSRHFGHYWEDNRECLWCNEMDELPCTGNRIRAFLPSGEELKEP